MPSFEKLPEYLDVREGYACCRLTGHISLPEVVRVVSAAIAYAREHGISRLLVDAIQMAGFPLPTGVKQ